MVIKFLGKWQSGRKWKLPGEAGKASLNVVSRPGARKTWADRTNERARDASDRRLLADIAARKVAAKDAKRAHFEAVRARAAARASIPVKRGRGPKNKLRI